MPKYRRLFIYSKNTMVTQMQLFDKTFTIEYNIVATIAKDFTILYNIENTDARELWTSKQPEKALWELPDSENPTHRDEPVTVETIVADLLLTESGDYLITEDEYFIAFE